MSTGSTEGLDGRIEEDLVLRTCREAPPGEYWGTEGLCSRIKVNLVLRTCREAQPGEYWGTEGLW